MPYGTLGLAVILSAARSDWPFDLDNLIRAGLKVLRGHVEICIDSYSVVTSLNLEIYLYCLFFHYFTHLCKVFRSL